MAKEDTVLNESFVDTITKRRSSISIALKLGSMYEFSIDGDKIALFPDRYLVNHSWSDAKPVGAPKDYIVKFGPRAQINLPLGVTVVIGKSSSGKTTFVLDYLAASAHAARSGSVHYIKAFEPGANDGLAKLSYTSVPTFEVELASTIAHQLSQSSTDIIIIDSLRYLFYSSSGGATGKGGVNMGLFMDLTFLDNLARQYGKRVVVLVNPMTNDDDAVDFYTEAAVGAVSGVARVVSPGAIKFSNRDSENREFIDLKLPRRADVRASSENATINGHGKSDTITTKIFDRKG